MQHHAQYTEIGSIAQDQGHYLKLNSVSPPKIKMSDFDFKHQSSQPMFRLLIIGSAPKWGLKKLKGQYVISLKVLDPLF